MQIIIASVDRHLGPKLHQIVTDADRGFRVISTKDLKRIIMELKLPERLLIVDVAWKDIQKPGALKQLVNIARITGNKVICICPNQEEDLKKLAKNSRVDEVFIRYDLELAFKEYIETVQIEVEED